MGIKEMVMDGLKGARDRLMAPPAQRQSPVPRQFKASKNMSAGQAKTVNAANQAMYQMRMQNQSQRIQQKKMRRALKSYQKQEKFSNTAKRAISSILPTQGFAGRQYYATQRAPQRRMHTRPTQYSRQVPPQFQRAQMQPTQVSPGMDRPIQQMREVRPVFKPQGGQLMRPVENRPIYSNPNGQIYEDVDVLTGRRFMRVRPAPETWISA